MRRGFLGNLLGLTAWPSVGAATNAPKSKILIKSAWGSADPTQASFPFHHGNAFAEAGHEVQIFLLGEAVTPMRTAVANSVVPVGWPGGSWKAIWPARTRRLRTRRSSSASSSGRTRS